MPLGGRSPRWSGWWWPRLSVVLTSTAGRAVPGSGRVSSTAGVGGKPPDP